MSRHGSESKKQRKYKEAKMLRNFTGSTGIRAAIAVLMLLFVVACSGSDSGIKRERDEARAAAEAEAQARMDAEAAAKKAAEEAAEAARVAAEEAAAQAERDKQAAVAAAEEAARQQVIAQQQMMAVTDAVAAAQAAVAALMDASSDADVTGAMADIAKATAAITAATSFSAEDTAMYTAQVAAIQANLTLAEANIRAHRAELAAQEAMNQATASARAKQAVDEAIAALTAADQAEAMSTAAYTAAAAALSTAQTAVANADADTLADASAALAAALADAATAAADLGVKTQAVTDATAALEAARTTLASVDPTHVALQAATAALERAQTEANNQAEAIKALQKQIADLQKAEQDRMTAAERMAEEKRMKEMAASGKALMNALGTNPIGNLAVGSGILSSSGLSIQSAADAAATPAVSAVTLKAGDSAGSLGSWAGKHYALTDSVTKVVNQALVYTNQGPPMTKDFDEEYGTDGDSASDGTYVPADRELTLNDTGRTNNKKIKASEFASVGTKTHKLADGASELSITGMYDGVSGTYYCTPSAGAADNCTSARTSTGAITLGGEGTPEWKFIHPKGAMISRPDPDYLYFGWWLRKDKAGMPTRASAFTGDTDADRADLTAVNEIGGTATYAGKAAGKFAIYNPLESTGDAGHFTADATLTAKFSGTGAGVTGTINNFMANEKAVPWSVKLNNNTLVTDDDDGTPITVFETVPTEGTRAGNNISASGAIESAGNYAWTNGDESKTTVWSIDGNSAGASGTWSGQMYDEAPSGSADDDDSNVPTTVTGTFQSEFGSIGRMVGGFGAEKQ